MMKTELRNKVMKAIRAILPEDIGLESADVIKLNDMHLHGIVFKEGDFGATFYVEDFSDDTKDPADIADEILAAYEMSIAVPPIELLDRIKNMQVLENMRDHLILTLADIEKNHDFLQTVPYKEIGNGLVFICRAFRAEDDGSGIMCTTVTSDLVEANGWDPDEMFALAAENTLKVNPPKLFQMSNALFGLPSDDLLMNDTPIRSDDMLVLTNDVGMFGAAALFLPDMVEKLLERIGQSFFAIPSSQHEYILLPESSGCTLPSLKAMCREANENVVALKDILSDKILYVSAKGILSY